MENRDIFLNKRIPTMTGIVILMIIASIIGGFLVWKCQKVGEEILLKTQEFPRLKE